MGLLSGLGKVDWGSVANGLGAAQSFFDGDFATGSGLLAYGAKQRSAAQKARDEEEERRRLREAARKAFPNASEAELDLYMSGDMRTSDLRQTPEKPYRFEDNAGNVWERGQDGQNNLIFVDKAPRTFMQDGQLITPPNPYGNYVNGGGGYVPPVPQLGTPSQEEARRELERRRRMRGY